MDAVSFVTGIFLGIGIALWKIKGEHEELGPVMTGLGAIMTLALLIM